MRVIGTIRSTATERITVEADSYQKAAAPPKAQIPEGPAHIPTPTNADAADT